MRAGIERDVDSIRGGVGTVDDSACGIAAFDKEDSRLTAMQGGAEAVRADALYFPVGIGRDDIESGELDGGLGGGGREQGGDE